MGLGLAGEESTGTFETDGEKGIVASCQSSGTPWVLIASVSVRSMAGEPLR